MIFSILLNLLNYSRYSQLHMSPFLFHYADYFNDGKQELLEYLSVFFK